MHKKLNFSTLVAFVKTHNYVATLDELNQAKRRREFAHRIKIVSNHRVYPTVLPLKNGAEYDAHSFSFTHWLVWASALEEEGYVASVIVVPVNGEMTVQKEVMKGFDCHFGGRVSFKYFDVSEDVKPFVSFVQGWISSPRPRFTALNLSDRKLPDCVYLGRDVPVDPSLNETTLQTIPGLVAERRGDVIELISVDGTPVEMLDKEETADG